MLKMNNKAYDILSKLQRWLPALGIFYMALCAVWSLPYGKEVNETILAVAAFLAATLEISTGEYHKNVAQNILDAVNADDLEETELADDSEAEETESEDGIEA